MTALEVDAVALVVYAVLLVAVGVGLGALVTWLVGRRRRPPELSESERLRELYATFSEISHSLKTAMDVFRGHLHNVRDEVPSDPEELERHAENLRVARSTMMKQVDDLEKLYEQLDLVVRLGLPGMPLRFGPVDVAVELEGIMFDLEPEAKRRKIWLEGVSSSQEGGAGRSLSVSGDRAALRRAFSYIIQNALRHAGEGARVAAQVYRRGDRLQVEIADTGKGIDAQTREALREGRGERVGMRLCQHLIELHGGKIGVASQPGTGTRVTVELPVLRLGNPPAGSPADRQTVRIW
jgi:signal transduction histidine kinase